MKKLLGLFAASALALCPALVSAQDVKSNGVYSETTHAMTAATWTLAAPADSTGLRNKVILGDATGLGCVWSVSASPGSGEGVPFSTTTASGFYVFDPPTPLNAIYVKCANAGTITIIID